MAKAFFSTAGDGGPNCNAPHGTTAQRPVLPAACVGVMYFDTTVGFPVWWNGVAWVDAAGALA